MALRSRVGRRADPCSVAFPSRDYGTGPASMRERGMPRCDRIYPRDYATSITGARMLACRVLVNSRACQGEIAQDKPLERCWGRDENIALFDLWCRFSRLE